MLEQNPFLVLWDASPLWGLLLARALAALRVPRKLVRAARLPEVLSPQTPALLVPGGSARRKAAALGPAGMDAIRGYVHGGGNYLGLCGGAGLALQNGSGGSLALCPWARAPLHDKLKHFLSGHIHISVPQGALGTGLVPPELPDWSSLPVWWPGRFAPCPHPSVQPLAAYGEPAPDFMVADLRLRDLDPEVLADWENLYGIRLWPSFLAGEPCLTMAAHGQGRAVLSYAHLETPQSPAANLWLAHLLNSFAGGPETPGGQPAASIIPGWDLRQAQPVWNDEILLEARAGLDGLIRLGRDHFLLYWREDWLLGWRRGIPGAALSSLLAYIVTALERHPNPAAQAYWNKARDGFAANMRLFLRGGRSYLLAESLAMTLQDGSVTHLAEQKNALFGPPPGFGGLLGELLPPLSELVRLALQPRELPEQAPEQGTFL